MLINHLIMIILETNSVSLGEVLVDGEVVAEDADATDLTRVPAARHQTRAVHAVVLRHLETMTPLDVEADLVLGVELPPPLTQLTLEHTLVGPVHIARFTTTTLSAVAVVVSVVAVVAGVDVGFVVEHQLAILFHGHLVVNLKIIVNLIN